jgi:hypothetical protein
VAQLLANVLIHLIFSTENREPLLVDKDLRQRAHTYLATVLRGASPNNEIRRGISAFSEAVPGSIR